MISTAVEEKFFRALAVSDGFAYARAEVIRRDGERAVPSYSIAGSAVPAEESRLRAALAAAADNLDELAGRVEKQLGSAHAGIFLAQKMIMMDPVMVGESLEVIREELLNAEAALVRVLDKYESRLLEVDDEYLKERASDIGEVRRRLLEILMRRDAAYRQAAAECGRPLPPTEPRIYIAEELTPSETVSLAPGMVAGFITEKGGRASHAAILARALGIPAISGIKGIVNAVSPGDWILLNGRNGEVHVNPLPSTVNLYPALRRGAVARANRVPPVEGFQVMANISTSAEVAAALAADAEGIGLYRTEFEFIAAGRLLSEDEQFDCYAAVAEAFKGRPLNIRLADMGGDKAAQFLSIPREDNPVLGYRGARLLLGQPDLVLCQARAIARTSTITPVQVIYPMIADAQQFYTLRGMFRQAIEGMDHGEIRHGVMFEVPSACVCAREMLKVADFGSIGSNDLIQYLFAVDRDNDLVAGDYTPDKAAFWRVLGMIAEASKETGKPVSLCGEMGGQTEYIPKLLEIGANSVSVSPRIISLARLTAKSRLSAIGS
ncbi:MAG: phosphoenolpyruvate--protein phosphotransferase [Candidatus Hydrogenedentes bacterium]|nr:phosphoenolpyruvate--protein phosphotransferase [Candidatus Hydrogenedentota bacterium]